MSGRTRRFTLDLALDNERAPRPGDVLVSARTVRRITEARPVESRVWPNRWAIVYVDVGTATRHVPDERVELAEGCIVLTTSLYRRGEGPADHFLGSGNRP